MNDRHTASTINDAQLDELYARLEKLGQTIAAFPDANDAANLAHARAQRDAFATRARDADAALGRVRALADRWDNALPVDKTYARELHATLDVPGPAATEATEPVVSVHGARDLTPDAREALDALIGVAKRAATYGQGDFALTGEQPRTTANNPASSEEQP